MKEDSGPANVPDTAEQDEKIHVTTPTPRPELKNLANSVLVGDVNLPKTRVVILELADEVSDDQAVTKERVTLVMSERSRDRTVEAFVQYQNWDSCPYDPIPAMPTSYHADRYAAQFCALMKKDGYKVVEDNVMRHSDVEDYLLNHGFIRRSSHPSHSGM